MSKKIELRGKHAVGAHRFAIVDDDMHEALAQHAWKAKPNGSGNNVYAVRNTRVNGRNTTIRMHRVVLGYSGSLDIDHINRNSLDNRRENLRVATRRENVSNGRTMMHTIVCKRCRQPHMVERLLMHRPPSFCSDRCASAYASEEARTKAMEAVAMRLAACEPRQCAHCGRGFVTLKAAMKFCSESCKKSAKWFRQRAEGVGAASRSAQYQRTRRAGIKAAAETGGAKGDGSARA